MKETANSGVGWKSRRAVIHSRAVLATGARRGEEEPVVISPAFHELFSRLSAIALVRAMERVQVINPVAEIRETFAADMTKELGTEVTGTEDVESAVKQADIIVTASSSHDPVFDGNWVRPGTPATWSMPICRNCTGTQASRPSYCWRYRAACSATSSPCCWVSRSSAPSMRWAWSIAAWRWAASTQGPGACFTWRSSCTSR